MKGCRPLTPEEVERAMRSFSGRYAVRNRALFILGIRTGFRISELLSLRVGDVWESGGMVVRVSENRMARIDQNRRQRLRKERQACHTLNESLFFELLAKSSRKLPAEADNPLFPFVIRSLAKFDPGNIPPGWLDALPKRYAAFLSENDFLINHTSTIGGLSDEGTDAFARLLITLRARQRELEMT